MSQKIQKLAVILGQFAGATLTPKMFAELLKREMPDAVSAIGNTPVYYSVQDGSERPASYSSYPILFDKVANGYRVREASAMVFPARKGRGETSEQASKALDALIESRTAPTEQAGS